LIENVVRPVERTEKAGVGGSTPSLATMFSSTYKALKADYVPLRSKNLLALSGFASTLTDAAHLTVQ